MSKEAAAIAGRNALVNSVDVALALDGVIYTKPTEEA